MPISARVAVLFVQAPVRPLARRIAAALDGAELLAPAAIAAPEETGVTSISDALRALFAAARPIVALCASGIVIRAIAPVLGDKTRDPPVLAVAADGSCVVPLLGGHRGANRLATRIARAIHAIAAVTTASDLDGGAALDDPPPGWTLSDPARFRPLLAALARDERLAVHDETGLAAWLGDAALPATAAAAQLLVSIRASAAAGDRPVLIPRRLALGVGCERGAPEAALHEAVEAALAAADLDRRAVGVVVSHTIKAAEPAVHALAAALGVPARFFPAERLLAETDRLTERSDHVMRATGCWGVAEGAALAAAGPGGSLLVPKRKGDRVTVAIALAPQVILPEAIGRARGRLSVVGIGPGDPGGRTRAAEAALLRATDLVGYGLYLDLVEDLAPGATRHRFALGEEEARCRHALGLAASGRDVALVCSGDPGIFAMATLVCELLADATDPGCTGVAIEIVPGVSAMQVAAARTGGLLGHDFAAISLSDLLTPWPLIEARLEAAARADLVVALYNPVSQRRREALPRALAILGRTRPPSTPVVLARNLGREHERCVVTSLAALDPETVDMLTVVLIGASTSRSLTLPDGRSLAFTPRGYRLP